MKYVTPEYQQQLNNLADTLCPRIGHIAVSPDHFGDMHEHEPPTSKWDEAPSGGWDSMGNYFVQDVV